MEDPTAKWNSNWRILPTGLTNPSTNGQAKIAYGAAHSSRHCGIGIAQIAIYGIGLELLPGPVLLWIAYDIYKRIGKEPPFTKRDQQRAIPEELPENTTAEAMPEAA